MTINYYMYHLFMTIDFYMYRLFMTTDYHINVLTVYDIQTAT